MEIVRMTRLFSPLFEAELIEEINSVAKVRKVSPGEILIDIGETITTIPLMLEGSIKIMREDNEGHELFLYYIESGSTCAATLTCCINNSKSNVLAIVEEEATFLAIPIDYMEKWMSTYKSWRNFIMQNYAKRYDELLDVVDLLAFKKMDARILNYIQEKAHLHHAQTINASHQQIAYDLNTSREVVSRIVKQMERKGILELSRGKIKLLTPKQEV